MKIWNLGYPRIGRSRELKRVLESYWSGSVLRETLFEEGRKISAGRWQRQHELGVESIPLDFSFYDPMLDMAYLLGAVPKRFQDLNLHWIDRYFTMARGVGPLDMTKWFNTNYHYLVPELNPSTEYKLQWEILKNTLEDARAYPYKFHPVFIGPWTFVKLSQLSGVTSQDVLQRLLPLYVEILKEMKRRGFEFVQMDEPALCQDLLKEELRTIRKVYESLNVAGMPIMLSTYFDSLDPWLSELSNLPVAGLHLDLVNGKNTMGWLKTRSFPRDKILSLGIVDGKNIWAANLSQLRNELKPLFEMYDQQKIWIAPSCSLQHLPQDKHLEKKWDEDLLSWVSFADQRLEELFFVKQGLFGYKDVEAVFIKRDAVLQSKAHHKKIHRGEVKAAVERVTDRMRTRFSPYVKRQREQKQVLALPVFPTTTIGSFPQTVAIRKARADFRSGKLSDAEYETFLKHEVETVIRLQERLGLDVLVHGESERTDMVEYFADMLDGFAFSSHGWVQSYGSRCVKPPVLYGDVQRKKTMTVDWFEYAQGLTQKPVKAMLTGPVTILNWSFVREDQTKERTANQLALAIRAEVADLEKAGARIIQIDEAAIREGLPIKRVHWNAYLKWAVDAFNLCCSAVKDETQVQTHMCYSEFGHVMDSLQRLEADVLLIEFSRSGKNFTDTFRKSAYQKQIGPGVYDIHSSHIPTEDECCEAIEGLLGCFAPDRLWINPDCGLKTRKYEEIEPALENMVSATKRVRQRLKNAA